jgi:Ser-tRNA(Ala) deacylase AlaX
VYAVGNIITNVVRRVLVKKVSGVNMSKTYCIIDINGNMIAKSKDKQKLEKVIENAKKKAENNGKLYQFERSEYAIVNY